MKNNLLFIYSTNILVRLLTVNMKNCLTPKNPKMCDPILVTLLKMRPHYSQSSRENATPSSGTFPLASYKEVPPPRVREERLSEQGPNQCQEHMGSSKSAWLDFTVKSCNLQLAFPSARERPIASFVLLFISDLRISPLEGWAISRHHVVCYTAVFSVVTHFSGEERCVTTLKTAV